MKSKILVKRDFNNSKNVLFVYDQEHLDMISKLGTKFEVIAAVVKIGKRQANANGINFTPFKTSDNQNLEVYSDGSAKLV